MPTSDQPMQPYSDLRRGLTRHRKLAVTVFAAASVLAIAGPLLMPRSYYSRARLLVGLGQENLIDPATTGGQLVSPDDLRASQVNSTIETTRSRAVLDRVVAELGPEWDGRRENLEKQIADTDAKLLANESDLKTVQAKIASLAALLATLPEAIATQSVDGANAELDGMRQKLHQLETQQEELAAKMNENHPRLAAVREQILELRSILDNQPGDRAQETKALNPARQSLELALRTERLQAESLAERERSLLATQQQLRSELTALNAQAGAIDELERRVVLTEAHEELEQEVEQARVNDSLGKQRISRLSLVPPASTNTKENGPGRAIVLALGLLFAAASGIGAALAAAWRNPPLRSAAQFEAVWDLPLVGIIPAKLLRAGP